MRRLVVRPESNDDWPATDGGRKITLLRRRLINSGDKVVAFGSCFAREVRRALRDLGVDTYPKYAGIALGEGQAIGKIPQVDNVHHYSAPSIAQEIERALAGTRVDPETFWRVEWAGEKWTPAWVEPLRRGVYGASLDLAVDASNKLSAAIEDGINGANVVILTLGLTEAWRVKATGLYTEWDGLPGLEFIPTDYEQNYHAVRRAVDLILAADPNKRVVLTVSPVAFRRTYTKEDAVVANMMSKATLRAAAGQVCRELPHVTYWPSFEYVMGREDVHTGDGRHIKPQVVDEIMAAFVEAHAS